ncbi:type IV pilus modification PilV family protein [Anthocerotibacter panamensis]|uniref:type IV pilus modification PilV family protein n=1 Tax=Anthocerotibacter panamensis TaxID=2857077 RepID=UPI001C404AC4|nr:type II secretion system protein [Anthocerotibacter panamensis]
MKKRYYRTSGSALVEVLVAIVVLSIFLVGLLPLVIGSTLLRKQQQYVVEATNLAQLQIEETRRYWSLLVFSCDPDLGSANPNNPAYPINFQPISVCGAPGSGKLDPAFPLFGETTSACVQRLTTTLTTPVRVAPVTDKDTPTSVLNDPSTVTPTDPNIVNYALRTNVQNKTAANCIYKDSTVPPNDTQDVRYVAQLFWGRAPTSTDAGNLVPTPAQQTEVRRVVVRIYQANPRNSGCNFGTAQGLLTGAELTACLPLGATTQVTRPNLVGSATSLDFSAPLVVLTADIPRPKS